MSVKKAFIPLITFLQANSDKKVKSVLDEITELCSAKTAGGSATTFHRDENGVVTHVFDYYFKRWMPLSHVEFGSKQGSASGYNSMCKEGVANWTKQQRDFRKAKEELLSRVAEGEVQASDIPAELEKLEAARTAVVPHSLGIGFETIEEALAADPAELDALVAAGQELPEHDNLEETAA